eukprot:4824446-Ditylum_brightwellii.AAC.1
MQQHQFEDLPLNNMRRQNPQRFPVKKIEGRSFRYYRDKIDDPVSLWCIALPAKLVVPVIIWYHHVFGTVESIRCFGVLPACHAALMPWSEKAIDLIWPWKINIEEHE